MLSPGNLPSTIFHIDGRYAKTSKKWYPNDCFLYYWQRIAPETPTSIGSQRDDTGLNYIGNTSQSSQTTVDIAEAEHPSDILRTLNANWSEVESLWLDLFDSFGVPKQLLSFGDRQLVKNTTFARCVEWLRREKQAAKLSQNRMPHIWTLFQGSVV